MKQEFEKLFEEFEIPKPINLEKIIEIKSEENDQRTLGLVESKFYSTNELLCYNFYKNISRVMNNYDI